MNIRVRVRERPIEVPGHVNVSGLGFGWRVVVWGGCAGASYGAKVWGKDLEGSGLYNKAYYTRIKGLETSGTIF